MRTVTIILPPGYATPEEFALDCEFDLAPQPVVPAQRPIEPRPADEYHEDMGAVLWWCFERQTVKCEKCNGSGHVKGPSFLSDFTCCPDCDGNGYCETGPSELKGEPPYVGTPNDVGFTVQADIAITLRTHADPAGVDGVTTIRRDVGGWPGYHTHFTPLLVPTAPSVSSTPSDTPPDWKQDQAETSRMKPKSTEVK